MKFKKQILYGMFLLPSFLTGCSADKNNSTGLKWIADSVSKELRITLPLDALSIAQKFQIDSIHPIIIATAKIDQLNGGFFIYQWINNRYQLVYKKAEPVYTVQYSSTGRYVVFESGFTGTGQKNTFFYLVEINPTFCSETWKGIAAAYNFTSAAPYHSIDGSIQLNDESLFYTRTERTYLKNEFEMDKPDSIVSRSGILKFMDLPSPKH